jgi:hypothetical protein
MKVSMGTMCWNCRLPEDILLEGRICPTPECELLETLVAHGLIMVERKPSYNQILLGDVRHDQIEVPS